MNKRDDNIKQHWKIFIGISPQRPRGLVSFGGGRVPVLQFSIRERQRQAARKLKAAGYAVKSYFEAIP